MKYLSHNLQQTYNFAKKVSNQLEKNTVLLLDGDIGAGKTTFTKMLLENLGCDEIITSPTFNIHQQYEIENKIINHFDFYRMNSTEDILALGFEDLITNDFLSIIEWSDLVLDIVPLDSLFLHIDYTDFESRLFTLTTLKDKA